MQFSRRFTQPGTPVVDQIAWKIAIAEIPGVFKQENVEVPAHWSQTATNILAQKYFRKAGVPNSIYPRNNEDDRGLPLWLIPAGPLNDQADKKTGGETSAKQLFHRLAGHWTYMGWKENYFSSEESAQTFYDEIYYMLAMQIAAPNSPQWFNTGLWWAYGISGSNSGQWRCDPQTGEPKQLDNSYEFPQIHACFINSISDNLVEPNGIFDLLSREARIFKFGSGTGSNFSNLRGKGEPLSGGGKSSGLMSFLDIFDKAAGAIQSGGTTRRAAKMVVLDMDHPEIEDFISWKVKEENKAAAMYVGSIAIRDRTAHDGDGTPSTPVAIIDRINNGITQEIIDIGWEGEALRTVSGQNSNNSVRVRDSFLSAVNEDTSWDLIARSTGKPTKTVRASDLWNSVCSAAWASADPGVQFHDNINRWNTCSADGEIVSTNPCGEYNFLDDTACNLASINLVNALIPNNFKEGIELSWTDFKHITHFWTVVLDISVSIASFPSREIAIGSWKYRTLGLGFANLGALFMRLGLPYDSAAARTLASKITAIMHGIAYKTSHELAKELSPFPGWKKNATSMNNIIGLHLQEATKHDLGHYYDYRPKLGFRNAQVTLIAPTGTISFVMDCDTTGIEPDFSLIKHKALAGGGSMNLINESIGPALKFLSYGPNVRQAIIAYLQEHKTLNGCTALRPEHLPIFACAEEVSPLAHIQMMAAVQPFLSGAISKTINLPSSATVSDINYIYRESHRLGLKCIALYRDGSKLTQPLNKAATNIVELKTSEGGAERSGAVPNQHPIQSFSSRNPLPPKRSGYARKIKIGGHSIFIHTGEYPDGSLGEIFLELSHQGSTLRAFANSFAIAVSIGLQYGVPLSEFVEAFIHTKFEPAGIVENHESIKLCSSILDLIARELGITYLGLSNLANVQTVPVSVSVDTVSQISKTHETISYKIVASGDICWECGNAALVRTGTCTTCTHCGANSGCG